MAVATGSPAPHRFAFIFPMASGHINPSLPMARTLVGLGHEVHYLCREQMRGAIVDTGAIFHSDIEVETELYEGREPDIFGAMESFKKEHGVEGGMFTASMKLLPVMTERMLPGVVRWLKHLQPRAIVYCPLVNREAALAGKVLGIPSVALLTTAGPGSLGKAMPEILAMEGLTLEDLELDMNSFEPLHKAVQQIKEVYGLDFDPRSCLRPLGKLDMLSYSHVTLVTTSEELQDPMDPKLQAAYDEEGVRFEAVGPLLDQEGAKRAAGHKFDHTSADCAADHAASEHAAAERKLKEAGDGLAAQVRAARQAGRQVVLASMGTVITGDSPEVGWEGRMPGPDGRKHGLTGRELCQAAWGGVFDVFGAATAEEGPLIVLSLGPQQDALGDLRAPPNAICLPVVPQVDVLKAGVDLFLTHGGQNSFTEALASGAPVVVCPGFGDQPVNARKAEAIGVGLKVDRPDPADGEEAAACAAYRSEVAAALRRVTAEPHFKRAATLQAESLRLAGGVPRAVELLLEAAGLRHAPGASSAEPKPAEVAEVGKETPAEEDEVSPRRRHALLAGA